MLDILSFGYLFKILDIHSVRELLNITDASLNRVANQAEQHMRITNILSNYRKKLETLTPF